MEEIKLEIRNWLDTWAPNCGAPRAVFEGQFKALMQQIVDASPQGPHKGWIIDAVKRACR